MSYSHQLYRLLEEIPLHILDGDMRLIIKQTVQPEAYRNLSPGKQVKLLESASSILQLLSIVRDLCYLTKHNQEIDSWQSAEVPRDAVRDRCVSSARAFAEQSLQII